MMSGVTIRMSAAMPMQRYDFFLLLQVPLTDAGEVSSIGYGFRAELGRMAGLDGGVYGGGAPLLYRGSWKLLDSQFK